MKSPYRKLALVVAINALIMYFVTYARIETFDHFHFNINAVYMALMMAAPTVILVLLVMGGVFPNGILNASLYVGAAIVFMFAIALARHQIAVGNIQFLRSMIPHQSSAILMCQEAEITDPDTIVLCRQILRTQRDEIEQMEKLLARLRLRP